MALKVISNSIAEEFEKAMREKYRLVAKPATLAMQDLSVIVKSEGRADIAAAGFGKRWQNTFRVDTYPRKGKVSINAAALVYHKIPYADVFETGATIRGKPKLWLPLPSTPKKIGRRKMSPEVYRKEIGPLFPIKRAGKPTLLVGKVGVNKNGKPGKLTTSKLRRGASGSGVIRAVPLFVGVDSVKLRDRFSLREITNKAAARLPQLYVQNFRDE